MKKLPIILLFAALHGPGVAGGQTDLAPKKPGPDLVIGEVFFQERSNPPGSSRPPEPGSPQRAIGRPPPRYEFHVLVSNQGDRAFFGNIEVMWEEMEWMTRPLRGGTEASTKPMVLSTGEAVWITANADQAVRDRSWIRFLVEAIPVEGQLPELDGNNEFEWQVERNGR